MKNRFSVTIAIIFAIGCGAAYSQEAEQANSFLPDYPPWRKVIEELPNPVEVRSIQVDGRQRAYRVYVPKHTEPLPVLLMFPGLSGTYESLVRHFAPHAEKECFIALWPEYPDPDARKRMGELVQRLGVASEEVRQERKEQDFRDAQTMRAAIADVARRAQVDRSRIFAVGTSRGGMFCHGLASHASDLVAGIVPVIGVMNPRLDVPKQPVSVLAIIGDKDATMEMISGGDYTKANATMTERYRKLNGMKNEPVVSRLPDKDKTDGMSVRVERYLPGENGAKLELWVVEGGGHSRHGRPWEGNPNQPKGKRCHDFYLPEVVWDFCKKCPPRQEALR